MSLSVDVDRLSEFFTLLLGAEATIELRVGDEWRKFTTSPEEAAGAAAEKAEELVECGGPKKPGSSLWFGVAPRVEGSTRGTATDIYPPRCLFVDIDNYPVYNEIEMNEALSLAGVPDPTFVVSSGGGHHLYWAIEGHLTTDEWAPVEASLHGVLSAYQERSHAQWHVDKAVKDATRIMQVPGVPNFKYGADKIAHILDEFSTEARYSLSEFDLSGDSRANGEFKLPKKIVGTGSDCTYPGGGQDAAIMEFAFDAFHNRNISYQSALAEGRRYFCDAQFCDPPVPWEAYRDRVSRAYGVNQERRRQYAERNQGGAPGRARDTREEVSIQQAATWVVDNFLGERAKSAEGMGLMVYSSRDGKFLGGVFAESQVRSGLVSMAEQNEAMSQALRAMQSGSLFTAVYKEVQARAERVPLSEVSSERGIIPLKGGNVLDVTTGKIVDRSQNPPFFNWLSPANENDLTSAISDRVYGAWSEFLDSSVPDKEEQDYLGRLMYYAALGGNHNRVFVMLYGKGSTGKNVFFESVTTALHGEMLCAPSTLVCKSNREYDITSQINLSGYRVVYCDEINRTDKLDTSKVKALTSDSGIKARAAYAKEDTKSSNTFVLSLLTNYLPEMDEADEALMNRLHFVTFRVDRQDPDRRLIEGDTRPHIDPTLKSRIKDSDVLAWVANHRHSYNDRGLDIPESFMEEMRAWFRSIDSVGAWATDMLECARKGAGYKVKVGELHNHYLRDMGKSKQEVTLPIFKRKMVNFFERKNWDVEDVVIDHTAAYGNIIYGKEELV